MERRTRVYVRADVEPERSVSIPEVTSIKVKGDAAYATISLGANYALHVNHYADIALDGFMLGDALRSPDTRPGAPSPSGLWFYTVEVRACDKCRADRRHAQVYGIDARREGN